MEKREFAAMERMYVRTYLSNDLVEKSSVCAHVDPTYRVRMSNVHAFFILESRRFDSVCKALKRRILKLHLRALSLACGPECANSIIHCTLPRFLTFLKKIEHT